MADQEGCGFLRWTLYPLIENFVNFVQTFGNNEHMIAWNRTFFYLPSHILLATCALLLYVFIVTVKNLYISTFFVGYFCVIGAWSATPTDYNNFTHGDCLCPSNSTGGMCQPGTYCPKGSLEPTLCDEGSYCGTPSTFLHCHLLTDTR